MHINENAPGNISQSGVTSGTDNETGFDPRRDSSKPMADEEIEQLQGRELIEPQAPGVEILPDNGSEITLSGGDVVSDHDDPSSEGAGEGLTDDQRVSRASDGEADGARVTPGPADKERLSE